MAGQRTKPTAKSPVRDTPTPTAQQLRKALVIEHADRGGYLISHKGNDVTPGGLPQTFEQAVRFCNKVRPDLNVYFIDRQGTVALLDTDGKTLRQWS